MPFAGYTDFDDCVAKNADKRDPEAYCAVIKRNVEDSLDDYERINIMSIRADDALEELLGVSMAESLRWKDQVNKYGDVESVYKDFGIDRDKAKLLRLLGLLGTPFEVRGKAISPGGSVGLDWFEVSSNDYTTWRLKNADVFMAKVGGAIRIEVYASGGSSPEPDAIHAISVFLERFPFMR